MTTLVLPPTSISVLLPVFMPRDDRLSLHLLCQALESAFDQTYPGEFEILVVDDGSPTPVERAMQNSELSNNANIRWLRSERNNGIVHALNTGLMAARHELIARLDADDKWLSGKISAQMRLFERDEDLSIAATGMTVLNARGREVERHVRKDGWNNILKLAIGLGWCPFPHGSVLALASVYRLLGGYSHSPVCAHCEDYHLWLDWIRFFKPAMVESVLYEYRQTSGRISEVYRREQELSTQISKEKMAGLNWMTFPENMRRLADLLGVNLLQCGAICYRLWRFKPVVKMPKDTVEIVRSVLPDRDISVERDGLVTHHRIMDLTRGFPGARSSTAVEDDTTLEVH